MPTKITQEWLTLERLRSQGILTIFIFIFKFICNTIIYELYKTRMTHLERPRPQWGICYELDRYTTIIENEVFSSMKKRMNKYKVFSTLLFGRHACWWWKVLWKYKYHTREKHWSTWNMLCIYPMLMSSFYLELA